MIAHRVAALLVALAVLTGAVAPGPGGPACTSCAPGCPMHAHRVGCHRAHEASCHHGAPATGLRTACRHPEKSTAAAPTALRAVMPARVASPVTGPIARAPLHVVALVTHDLPEPPTGPPRARVLAS